MLSAKLDRVAGQLDQFEGMQVVEINIDVSRLRNFAPTSIQIPSDRPFSKHMAIVERRALRTEAERARPLFAMLQCHDNVIVVRLART